MVKYCKTCGSELDGDSIFCEHCGAKYGANTQNNTVNTGFDPFKTYNIDMINGEKVIRNSEMHPNCLIVPCGIIAMGFIFSFVTAIRMSVSYWIAPSFFGYLAIFLCNPLFIIGLVWLIIRYVTYSNTDLILTNKRVFGKCGLISTTQMQCSLEKINSVSYSNGLIGKILDYGTVRIATSSTEFKFRFIRDGQTLYNDIFKHLEIAEKEKMVENAEAIADAIEKRMEWWVNLFHYIFF